MYFTCAHYKQNIVSYLSETLLVINAKKLSEKPLFMQYNKVEGKDKGTLIFIHGNSSSSKIYDHIMLSEVITSTKIAIELAGHGSNLNGFSNKDFTSSAYSGELLDFINSIEDDILLLGNSMGGHLAIEIAPKVKRLKALVIFGTPPLSKPINFEEAFIPVAALQTFLTEDPTEEQIEEAAHIAVFNKAKATEIIKDFEMANPKVRSVLAADLMNNNFQDQKEIFINLNVKKFIIAGKQDPSVNPEYLKHVKDLCKDNCEIIFFDQCGHYPSLEKPEEFLKTIKSITTQIF